MMKNRAISIAHTSRTIALALLLLVAATTAAWAAREGVSGSWLTPTGDVVTITGCSSESKELCLTITKVGPNAPSSTDTENPDATLRSRPLCELKIGNGFKLDSPTAASGGQIYDPMSGKTYSAKMESKGDTLKLRGYIGVPALGRTETWTRTTTPSPCK